MMREFRGLFEVDLGRGFSAESGFLSLLLTFPSGVAADNFPLKLKGSDLKRKIGNSRYENTTQITEYVGLHAITLVIKQHRQNQGHK